MSLDKKQERFIEELYMDTHHLLMAYANSALDNRPQAEEAVQDTFRIACAKINILLSSENPRGWLVITLKNVIKNIIRSRARLNNLLISTIDFDESSVIDYLNDTDEDNIDLMYSDLAKRDDYKLLKKIALEKYTMLEAAQELGISIEACKKRVQRAKKKLQKYLKE